MKKLLKSLDWTIWMWYILAIVSAIQAELGAVIGCLVMAELKRLRKDLLS